MYKIRHPWENSFLKGKKRIRYGKLHGRTDRVRTICQNAPRRTALSIGPEKGVQLDGEMVKEPVKEPGWVGVRESSKGFLELELEKRTGAARCARNEARQGMPRRFLRTKTSAISPAQAGSRFICTQQWENIRNAPAGFPRVLFYAGHLCGAPV